MKTSRKLSIIVAALHVAAAANLASFDFSSGTDAGLGGAILLSRPSASTLVSLPAGLFPEGMLTLEIGASRKYALKELDRAFVAAGYRYRLWTMAIGISQLGRGDLYVERTLKAGLARQVNSFAVGGTVSALFVSFGENYSRLDAATFGGTVSYAVSRVAAAVVADNLSSPRLSPSSPAFNPKYSLYVEAQGERWFSLAGRMTLEEDERPQFGLGQLVQLSEHGALSVGLSTAPMQYGAGLELNAADVSVWYCTSYHPVLGFTHSAAFSLEIGRARRDNYNGEK
ncbi:MAG TPA: hypothetical protein VN285_03585 [Candidatus Deferrimicrobium sp.]|nr:hypothetical protein [Candidatus Deferrimicrobium sp.]